MTEFGTLCNMSDTPHNPVKPTPWTAPTPLPGPIVTERLIVRWWAPEDAASLHAAVAMNRAALAAWLPWPAHEHQNVHQTNYDIERMRRDRENASTLEFTLGIVDRKTGEAVGGTGLHRVHAPSHEAEIGYWIRPDLHRRGMCAEAVRHLISAAMMPQSRGGWGLRRIHIRCAGRNVASAGVPRSIGLREEARLVQDRWLDGQGWDDTLVFGVLEQEWDTQRHSIRAR